MPNILTSEAIKGPRSRGHRSEQLSRPRHRVSIAERSGLSFGMIRDAAEVLWENGWLAPVSELGTNGSVDADAVNIAEVTSGG